jgi:hypothetical protein
MPISPARARGEPAILTMVAASNRAVQVANSARARGLDVRGSVPGPHDHGLAAFTLARCADPAHCCTRMPLALLVHALCAHGGTETHARMFCGIPDGMSHATDHTHTMRHRARALTSCLSVTLPGSQVVSGAVALSGEARPWTAAAALRSAAALLVRPPRTRPRPAG